MFRAEGTRGPRSYDPGACGKARHRVNALPLSVSNVLPFFLATVASGSAAAEPSTSLRLGPAGACCCFCICAAAPQTLVLIASVLTWPFLSCSAICGGIPHLPELVSTYLTILVSAWRKLPISLQASSGVARRSPAAFKSAPRFSASWRNGMKSFMHSSGGPPWVGGAAKGDAPADGKDAGAGALPKAEDAGGGAPKAPDGAAPLTGGKAGSFAVPALPGSGAGNAPCAKTCPALNVTTAATRGAINWRIMINWRIIKAIPSGLQASSR